MSARVRRLLDRIPTASVIAAGKLSAGSAVLQLGFLLALVLVARELGPSDVGTYSIAVAIGAIVVSGAGSGLPALVQREVAAGRADAGFLAKVSRTQLQVTSAATVAAVATGGLFIGGARGLLLGGLSGLANVAQADYAVVTGMRAGLQDFRAIARSQVVCGIGVVLLTFAALRCGTGVAGCVVAPGLAALACTVWLRRPLAGIDWSLRSGHAGRPDGEVDRSRLFGRSLPFLGTGLLNGGYQRIDVLIVGAVRDVATAGVYAAAYRVLGVFTVLARGFGVVFFSRLSRRHTTTDAAWHDVRRRGTLLFALTVLPLAGLCGLAMPVIVDSLYGTEFASSVTPARLLLLSLIPYSLYLPNAHALNALGQEGRLFRVLLVGVAVESALVGVFASLWGAPGAAIAWCAAELVVLVGITRAVRPRGPVAGEGPPAPSGDALGAEA